VLLVGDTDDVKIGAPLVANARVVAEVVGEARGEKIIVFKYKRKKRYRRRTGHRQDYTRIAIKTIEA
jgi:large subunit ribosomal protein L21